MDDEQSELRVQIERCRRLASTMIDDDLRHSLEDLAREYEDQLADGGEGFMLCGNEREERRRGSR